MGAMNTTLIRRIRLVTGLVLLVYVVSHLANLSLGLMSLETMDAARPIFMYVWHTPIGLFALYGSLLGHMLLGLVALYARRTLRMSPFDTMQLIMALLLPPLLVLHVLGTRGLWQMVDFESSYAWLMVLYWKWQPWSGLRQVLVVVVAWIHGCMGFYYWAHVQRWWGKISGVVYPLALLVPVLALLGFVEGGKQALALAEDDEWMTALLAKATAVDEAVIASVYHLQNVFLITYTAMIAAVLALRAWRRGSGSSEFVLQVSYLNGPTLETTSGISLLEVSRLEGVPHTSMCGGKGRCGTCRVRILEGGHFLPKPSALEAETLARVDADADVRLACQTVPAGSPLTISRLVGIGARVEAAHAPDVEPTTQAE